MTEAQEFRRFVDGRFEYPNGDEYEGTYIAHISGLVWREGRGIYSSVDGHVYNTEWYGDQIMPEVTTKVTYPNGDGYLGKIKKNKYEGDGAYYFKHGILNANFTKNRPVDDAIFIDYKGKFWFGIPQTTRVILVPELVFWNEMDDDYGKGQSKLPPEEEKVEEEEKVKVKEEESCTEIIRRVFGPSSRIPVVEPDPKKVAWYQDYLNSIEMEKRVRAKLLADEDLDVDDLVWYQQQKNSQNLLEKYYGRKLNERETLQDFYKCQRQNRHLGRDDVQVFLNDKKKRKKTKPVKHCS